MVITNNPKIRIKIKIGIANISVTNAINPDEAANPIQPPPSRIAVAPVPVEPFTIWARDVVLVMISRVPIVIRPISRASSVDLNNR